MLEHLNIVLQPDRIKSVCCSKRLFQPIARVRVLQHPCDLGIRHR